MPHLARSIGWGFYAASSWTWCIGMFLPAVLMQWFGWGGFLLIAIPNCIGAAAMGLLLGSPGASRRFCRRHPLLIRSFERITIAFHLVFLAVIGRWLLPAGDAGLMAWVLPLAGLVAAAALSTAPLRWWPAMATAALAFGLVVAIKNAEFWVDPGWCGTRPTIDLLWLSPVFIIGFLLCPWLDGPFHRARQEVNGAAASLVLGVAFLGVLLITATYWQISPETATPIVATWMIGQSVFTIAANLRESAWGIGSDGRPAPWGVDWFALLCILYVVLAATWDGSMDLYLRWLSLYGVFFPALVLAWCRRTPQAPTIDQVVRVIALLVVAAVLGEIGFIHGPAWVGAIAGLLALAAPMVAGRRRRSAPPRAGELPRSR